MEEVNITSFFFLIIVASVYWYILFRTRKHFRTFSVKLKKYIFFSISSLADRRNNQLTHFQDILLPSVHEIDYTLTGHNGIKYHFKVIYMNKKYFTDTLIVILTPDVGIAKLQSLIPALQINSYVILYKSI